MVAAAIDFRQAEKNTPPVGVIDATSVDDAELLSLAGFFDEPTNCPELCLLPEGPKEPRTQWVGSSSGSCQ